MVANSTFLWPYNWPLDWPFWCNLLTEGVVSYEELGNAKKALSKKCASSVHPKNATEHLCLRVGFVTTFVRKRRRQKILRNLSIGLSCSN